MKIWKKFTADHTKPDLLVNDLEFYISASLQLLLKHFISAKNIFFSVKKLRKMNLSPLTSKYHIYALCVKDVTCNV
jgi:hypothetical protein